MNRYGQLALLIVLAVFWYILINFLAGFLTSTTYTSPEIFFPVFFYEIESIFWALLSVIIIVGLFEVVFGAAYLSLFGNEEIFHAKIGMKTFAKNASKLLKTYLWYTIGLLPFFAFFLATFHGEKGDVPIFIPCISLGLLFAFRVGKKVYGEKENVLIAETKSIMISTAIIGAIYLFGYNTPNTGKIPVLSTAHLILLFSVIDLFFIPKISE